LEAEAVDGNVERAIKWLLISDSPWDEVREKWHLTYKNRMADLMSDATKRLTDYYDKFPVLRLPGGFSLVCTHQFCTLF